ncbi:periplasmic heavy metal sensor [Pseudoduganella plicata]|nr:periplasmic heavy metal sensor [Pseudoduganella plicata]
MLALPLASHAAVDGDDAGGPPQAPKHAPLRPAPADLRDDESDGPRGPGRPGPRGPAFGMPGDLPFLRGVDLTETQQDKVFAILHGQAPYLREQHKAREKAERALFDLHGSAKYDDAAAAKLAQAAAQAMANVTLQHLRTEQKVLAVLTAGQRKQVEDAKARPPRIPNR